MSAEKRTERAARAATKSISGPAALDMALRTDPSKLISALELCSAYGADLTYASLPGTSVAGNLSWGYAAVNGRHFPLWGRDRRDLSGALKCTILALFGSDLTKMGRGNDSENVPYLYAIYVGQLWTAASILVLTEKETWPTLSDHEAALSWVTKKSDEVLQDALERALVLRSRTPLLMLFKADVVSAAAATVFRAADETRRCLAASKGLLSATREAVAVFFMAMNRHREQHGVGLSDDIMLMLILPQTFTSAGGQAAALAAKLGVQALGQKHMQQPRIPASEQAV